MWQQSRVLHPTLDYLERVITEWRASLVGTIIVEDVDYPCGEDVHTWVGGSRCIQRLLNGRRGLVSASVVYKQTLSYACYLLVDGLQPTNSKHVGLRGFIRFPCFRSTGPSSEDITQGLICEESVAVVLGDPSGLGRGGFVLCSYATADDKVAQASRRIARFAQ